MARLERNRLRAGDSRRRGSHRWSERCLKNFTVGAALIARRPADDPEFAKFSQTLAHTNTHSETIEAGDIIHFGAVAVSVLWPPATGEKSSNNDSIVLRIQFGERSILLTGDIEQATERALLTSQQQLHADVIKVPHHGSKTSSTEGFVAATKPQLAIISVGRNSRFGHPHKEVVERWQSNGATVLTTGNSGTITVINRRPRPQPQNLCSATKRHKKHKRVKVQSSAFRLRSRALGEQAKA